LLLLVQLYFVLNLRASQRLGAEGSEVPWIGLYRDWIARVVTLVSALAVPPIVIAVLLFSSEGGETSATLATVLMGTSLVLGVWGGATLLAMWKVQAAAMER